MTESWPQVIHIGFAGARSFFNASEHPDLDSEKFAAAVQALLVAELRRIAGCSVVNSTCILCGSHPDVS